MHRVTLSQSGYPSRVIDRVGYDYERTGFGKCVVWVRYGI